MGKVVRLASEFTERQFAVFGGSSDYLLPTLTGGGAGCVTGIGNVFPKSVSRLFALSQAGKTAEAKELQALVAHAEKACKEGIAATKHGAASFAGPRTGLTELRAFYPRKPYLPVSKTMEEWVVKVMQHLEEVEDSLPDRVPHVVNGV